MNFLDSFRLILNLFPLIITAIKTIEGNIPDPGKGTEKLELIRSMLSVAYDNASNNLVTFDKVWPVIQDTIKAVVNTFNATGIFKKAA